MNRTAKSTVLGLMTAAVVVVGTLALSPSVRAQGLGTPSYEVNCDEGDSIQAVLDRVKDGVDIEVWGACDESLWIDKDRIRLIGKDGATLSAPAGSDSVILVEGRLAEIRDFQINAAGVQKGIVVSMGSATIVNNAIRNSIFSGIQVRDNGHATITGGNQIIDNCYGIQLIFGSRALIQTTTIDNADCGGVMVSESSATMIDNEIKNGGAGIYLRTSSSASIQNNNRIKNNTYDGVGVVEASAADIGGNTITGNGLTGVLVDTNSSVFFPDWLGSNKIEGNSRYGVLCGFSGALNVGVVQDFGTGNTPGDAAVDPPCHFQNHTGQPFP